MLRWLLIVLAASFVALWTTLCGSHVLAAQYTQHWAFIPPRQSALPSTGTAHPIDAIVTATLRARQLQPSPRAPAAKLCRRLYLDLIGLPPSPQELDAFERDGPDATIDRLLASERFGEKWARHWLDVARYCDTNGYEKDMPRQQWTWRDWVINALNADQPYDEFLIEQIAGDLLPQPTQQQIVATGFLRNSMINEEGAIVPEQFRMVEMFDRMDCVGKAVLGLTTQCAQCHSHKFDPLTHEEYYGMFAFLNNSYEAQSWVYAPRAQRTIDEIHTAIEAIEERVRADRPNWPKELEAWEKSIAKSQPSWTPLEATELGSISGLNHPVQLSDQSILMLGHVSADVFYVFSPELEGATGLRLEVLNHGDLPLRGPGRGTTGEWDMVEMEVFVRGPESQEWEKQKLTSATADASAPEEKQQDGKQSSGPVKFLIDGSETTSWRVDRGVGRRNQPSMAVVQFEKPLDVPAGSLLKVALRMNTMAGCCRVSITREANPVATGVDYAAIQIMDTPVDERTPEQQRALFRAWLKGAPELEPRSEEIDAQWQRYPDADTSVLHMAEREASSPRVTHLLDRGEWDRPLQAVLPHTPAFLHPLRATGTPDRLDFARWLSSDESPLTARVAVNRVWQAIFGIGLVETSEDFGTRAPAPENLELLDWLAVDFMQHGWSQKHLIRRIVTSATYQQDSICSAELLVRDPQNRWLARGPRFRAEAEVVRDIALCASGLITHKLGGPSVIPPVPQNVLDYNFTYPSYWKPAEGSERYRRTVYGFRKRSMPDPVMSSFDGPSGDTACARRMRSNTPLAALAGLNETIFVECAQAMALRVLREGGETDAERAGYAFRLCTGRWPADAERAEILRLLATRRTRLAEGWLSAREIAAGDPKKRPELPPNTTPQDAAAWTIICRVLLNLDETLSKN